MGLVLLDVGDGEERAVELEVGIAGRHLAEEGVRPGFQLFGTDPDVSGLTGELLDTHGVVFCFLGRFLVRYTYPDANSP